MTKMEENLIQEKKKLNELIARCDFDLLNDIILEQSRKVDRMIVACQRMKLLALGMQMAQLRRVE